MREGLGGVDDVEGTHCEAVSVDNPPGDIAMFDETLSGID